MNSYFNLQKINFVNTGNNNYTCYLLYEFTGYRKLLTFDLQLSDGQIVHAYIDASNNSIQVSNNPLNISLLPHIFYLKLQRINNNIKILEVQNADYITNSVIVCENNIYSLLDNIYMLSSLLLENKQDIENLEIAFKSELNNVLITINNILSRLLNVESISSQQSLSIQNIFNRLNNIDQTNNRQDNDIQNLQNEVNVINQNISQQSNQINNHTNTIFSLLDNIYMLSSLLLENKQDIENLEFALRDALINAFNNINNILSRLLNIEFINSQQNNQISKLNIYTEEVNSAYYSAFVVVNNFNAVNPEIGLLVYLTTTNELYKYTTSGWVKIDWQKIIQTMPEFQIGRLRINNNALEISPNGTNWYPCYPLIGASVFNIRTLDNQNYSYKYYLPPGATAIIENANHVPIVYTPAVVPMFFFQGFWTYAYEQWVGLRPSNIAISNGIGQFLAGHDTSVNADRSTNLSIVPFYEQGNTDENWNYATLTIRENQRWLVLGLCQGFVDFTVHLQAGTGTAPSASHWLGTWYRQDGVQFIANYVTITRRR